MFLRKDAPSNASTVEYAGAFSASAIENAFSLESFRRDFRVTVRSLTEVELAFDLVGIDAALANAFRRILLAEVPTMAIEKVFILNNTSMIQDEVLAQRLALFPFGPIRASSIIATWTRTPTPTTSFPSGCRSSAAGAAPVARTRA